MNELPDYINWMEFDFMIFSILSGKGPIGTFLWNFSTLLAWYSILFTFFGIIFSFNNFKPVVKFFLQKSVTVKRIHYYMKSNPDDGSHMFDYEFHRDFVLLTFIGAIFFTIPSWFFALFSSVNNNYFSFWEAYVVIIYMITLIGIPVTIYRIIKLLRNKNIYDGELKDGKMHGHGKLVIKNNIQQKFTINNRTCLSSSEIIYVGEFSFGVKHGLGKITLGNGEIYEGEFVDGLRHGKGKEISYDGVTYEGEWKNRAKVGQGIMTWPDGQKFVGKFEEKVFAYEGPYKISGDCLFNKSGDVVART